MITCTLPKLNTKAPYIRNSNPKFFFGFSTLCTILQLLLLLFQPNALCSKRFSPSDIIIVLASIFAQRQQAGLALHSICFECAVFNFRFVCYLSGRLHRIKAIFCHLILSSTFLHFFGSSSWVLTSVVPFSSLCIYNMIFGGCLFCIPLHELILYIILSGHINVSKLISRHKSWKFTVCTIQPFTLHVNSTEK